MSSHRSHRFTFSASELPRPHPTGKAPVPLTPPVETVPASPGRAALEANKPVKSHFEEGGNADLLRNVLEKSGLQLPPSALELLQKVIFVFLFLFVSFCSLEILLENDVCF